MGDKEPKVEAWKIKRILDYIKGVGNIKGCDFITKTLLDSIVGYIRVLTGVGNDSENN